MITSDNARRIGHAIVFGYISLAISAIAGFCLVPFVVHFLGPEQYGLWVLVSSVVGYIGLLDLGLSTGVTKYVAAYEAKEDTAAIADLASVAFTTYSLLAILAALATVLLALVASDALQIAPSERALARLVFLILGLNTCVGLPLTVLTAVLGGYQRYAFLYVVSLMSTLCTAALTIIAIQKHTGILGMAAITLVVNLGSGLVRWLYLRRQFPAVAISLRSPLRAHALLSYSGVAFVITVCAQIAFSTDVVVVGALLSVTSVAIYSAAAKLATFLMQVIFQAVDVFFPLLSHLEAVDDVQTIRTVYLEAVKLGLALAASFAMCLILFGDHILVAWLGPTFRSSYLVLVILSVTVVVHVPGHIAGIVLMAINKHRVLAAIATVDSVANLLLSIALVNAFGLAGVALGTAITIGVSNGVVVPLYACHILKLSFWTYVRQSIVAPLLIAILTSVAASIAAAFVDMTRLPGLVALMVVSIVLYTLCFWFIGLTARQRHFYHSLAQSIAK